ncbi:hypothetical protein AB0J86_05970 [Micromonospora sp. NPDC049559]|uniref:hypothetical protein n=1 Tax=Micromonospora sp. NPDC049559 TaxID=3155923 RepID=UPI0034204FEE
MSDPASGWRPQLNAILYTLTYAPSLDAATVRATADNIVGRGSLRAGPQTYHDALTAALASGEQLTRDLGGEHGEAGVRDFVTRLLHRLDELRPWPEPAYERQPIDQWPTFDHGRPVARVGQSLMNVQDRLRERFEKLPIGDGSLLGLILRLNTGETVALLGSYEKGNRPTLLQREPGDPRATIDAFRAATGLDENAVVPLTD